MSLRTSFCFLAFRARYSSLAGGGTTSIIPTLVFLGSNRVIPTCSNFDLKITLRVFFFRCFMVVLMTSIFCVGSRFGQSIVRVSSSSLRRMALDIVLIRLLPTVLTSYMEEPVGDSVITYLVVWYTLFPFRVFSFSSCLSFTMFTCCGWTTLGTLFHPFRDLFGEQHRMLCI